MRAVCQVLHPDELLTKQVDPNEHCLPSPNKLKRKVIIKNKKLSTNKSVSDVIESTSEITEEITSRAKKHSVLLIKFATEKKWNDFEVILTDDHICFTPNVQNPDEDEEDQEDDIYVDPYETEQLYDSEEEDKEDINHPTSYLWYHGTTERGIARSLLLQHRCHGDGTFLVRESGQGGLALSFLVQGNITHSIINSRINDSTGQEQFLIGNEVWHNSIPELVEYYKNHSLSYKEKGFSIKLGYAVKKVMDFEHEIWWFKNMDRTSAENYLRLIPIEGVFLVRPSSVDNYFSLSLRHRQRISHFQIEYSRGKFVLGGLRFASMDKLIKHFSLHSLYRTCKLTQPAQDHLIQEEDHSNGELYLATDYTDLGEMQKVTARALYDHIASTTDELSFKRGSYIRNVVIADQLWWRGDHGKDINKLFPSNYVQIMNGSGEEVDSTAPNEAVLNISTCQFADKVASQDGVYFFTVTHPNQPYTIQIGSRNSREMDEWLQLTLESYQKVGLQAQELQKAERTQKLAQELSDLVIYCQSVPYVQDSPVKFKEMSSFSEERIKEDDKFIVLYNHHQISRVYPKFMRLKSTNFDPVPKWNMGCQMVALNYQTPDKSMQVNQAMFAQNGRCGYVLRPSFMQEPYYHPNNVANLKGDVESIFLTVEVLGGRLLGKSYNDAGVMSPYVSIEIIGLPIDCQAVRTETHRVKNCLNPSWKNQEFTFPISCPDLAFIRFEVRSDENEDFLIGQETVRLKCVQSGYRSVQLKNVWSEPISLASLLVRIDMRNPREDEEKNLFRMLEETRKLFNELQTSDPNDAHKQENLLQTEQKLLRALEGIRGQGMKISEPTWIQ
ncbi:phosphoinositide phospholipase C [Elysia marginata]|uniref:Phosphoinositide phospholipase C n=1 Tax=Elysia marginata TaxID=1093978 RepID=A0AAV4K3J6_9GAST|nr:phosphoinositide phospholipase C [Elysia marginata]